MLNQFTEKKLRGLSGRFTLCEQAERMLPTALAGMMRKDDSWGLSRREEEVLTSLCGNLSDKELATALGISGETVHVHLRSAFKKLGVHDRQSAIQEFKNKWSGGAGVTLNGLPHF